MEIDVNKAQVFFKEDMAIKEQVATMVGFGLLPPKDLAEDLLNNPYLSEKGQETADKMYKLLKE